MKILALRGANLASLAEPFEVDFRREPLASAGLFAICGRTGSGKSTLLDALCLALYGDTPRLARAGQAPVPDVDDATITSGDVRGILRRGAGEGWAEVDFVGVDGIEYRARWHVRRARSRSRGKLQPVTMSLVRLADAIDIGGNKLGEVRRACEEKVGLRFEQFTRAVLLAQNQFAAFLQADDNERAELLEMLTGSERFSRISIRAYQRAKDEKAKLDQLKLRLAQDPLLGELERRAAEEERDAAARIVADLDTRRRTLQSWVQWYEQWRDAAAAVTRAEEDAAAARQHHLDAHPRRLHLARVDAAQVARLPFDACTRLAAEATDAAEALAASRVRVAQFRSNLERTLAAKHDERRRLDAEESSIQQWLAEHAPWQALAEQWQRWEVHLRQAAKAAEEIARFEDEGRKLVQAIDDAVAQRTQAEAEALHRAGVHTEAQRQAQAADAELAAFDEAAIAQERSDLDRAKEWIDELAGWRRQGDELHRRRVQIDERITMAEAAIVEASQRRERAAAELPQRQAALAATEQSLERARMAAARSVEDLRAQLEPDMPCPVCGSTQHPYVERDPGLRAALAALEADVAEHRRSVDERQQEITRATALCDGRREAVATAQRERDEVAAQLALIERAWREHPATADAPGDPAAHGAWLAAWEETQRAALARWNEQAQALAECRKRRDAAHATMARALEALRRAETHRTEAETHEQRVSRQRDVIVERRATQERLLATDLDALDDAFADGGWRASWASDPRAFLTSVQRDVDAWQQRARRLSEVGKAQGDVDRVIEELAKSLQGVDDVPAASIADTIETEETDELTPREIGLAFVRAVERWRQLAHAQRQSAAKLTEAEAALTAWLAAQPQGPTQLERADLGQLLAHDAAWIAAERDTLRQLEAACSSADGIVQDRRQRLVAIEQQRPTDVTLDELRAQEAVVGDELERAKEAEVEARVRLQQDDDRRRAHAALAEEIERQSAVYEVWGKLSEVIGSADGAKFRNLAQQMTLDVLLAYANRHLAALARRYRLERLSAGLGLLVIDQDMGDEMRTVHSLSGGESFLVSLALALGLASLSSQRVRVESLFVDEGFGSLDAESLRVAMEALDGLQAQGRKVGVISHVQEMTERIATQIRVVPGPGGRSRVEVA